MSTEAPDFSFLVIKQAAIVETFADALARLNSPIALNLDGACSLDRQVAQNVFLSTELERLQAGELDRQRVKELDRLRVGVLDQILRLIPSVDDSDLQNTNTRTRLQQLYSSAFNEGRKQIRQLILQVQDLQLGLKDMEETRRTILDIMGREQGKQLQLQEDIMAYVWTHLGGHQVEQETYRTNLALLKSINQQSKLTGGGLQWIYLKLIDYEAELKEMWESMVDAGIVTAEDGGGWGAGGYGETAGGPSSSTPGSANGAAGAGVHKKYGFSLQGEIDEIKRVTIKLKAKWAQTYGKTHAQAG
ncbi:hypothetical protein BGX24_006179 [Mortierella sp. AD032]|nr:hypothetical protein BGX24_006179 [Mortierella sp. AD032]